MELTSKGSDSKIRLIAFYLPQFHPIPENDEWWGKGFTEWTNVTKAKPVFPGHYQPHVPADLGYYDLRLPDIRIAQADLAREHGIHGFCYYHYWFNGKVLLERPIREILLSGAPDFPFCFCWANEPWTRAWDGLTGSVLLQQTYTGDDHRRHIHYLSNFFSDKRYIRVNGKPLFLIYRASHIPDITKTTEIFREEARKIGIGDIYLCRVESFSGDHDDPYALGFDAAVEFQPDWTKLGANLDSALFINQSVYRYGDVILNMLRKDSPSYVRYPCVTPSWDNSPRRGDKATILINSTPDLYQIWLETVLRKMINSGAEENLVFINAWNEWAEGSHLEPDQRFRRGYLEATQKALTNVNINASGPTFAEIEKSVEEKTTEEFDKFISQHYSVQPNLSVRMGLRDKLLLCEQNMLERDQKVACIENRLNKLKVSLIENEDLLSKKESELNNVLNSMSWKITAPLRIVYGLLLWLCKDR